MSVENLAGQTLGQYQLRELLGAGGMGAVYRAYQSNLKREVAVKVLPGSLVNEPGYVERFTREAEIAASLEHPHIVPIHDYGAQNGISYVVMRMLTGGSLADRLAQGKLASLGEIAALLTQLASALDYAHSQNVIHRDIKPNNVMFDNHGISYLVDFGIAKLLSSSTQITATGMIVGTPPFIAPELWKGEDASPASDQYALGVMAYLLVTGHPPFEAPTPHGLIYKHLNDMPTPAHTLRAGAPEALTLVLERALAKEPGQRFPTVTAFAQAFEGAIAGAEGTPTQFFNAPPRPKKEAKLTTAATVTPAAPPQRGVIRQWGWLAALMAAVLVVILLSSRSQQIAPQTTLPPTIPPTVVAAEATGRPSNTPALAPSATQNAVPTNAQPPSAVPPSNTPQPTLTPTRSPTSTPTATFTLTPTADLTATLQEFQTAAAATLAATHQMASAVAPSSTPVGHNTDWTPQIQTFDGVDMALVPAGCFDMGSADGDPDELPVNRQCFDAPFWMDRTEVTNAQFDAFKGQAAEVSQWTGANQPRETVSWYEARDFCALRGARLPTEAEWEYAARGPDDLIYPWGNEFVAENAVYDSNSGGQTADVGSKPGGASWVGALDLSGNVWEWVSSLDQPYPYMAGDGREDITRRDGDRVARGGAWNSAESDLRAAARFGGGPTGGNYHRGFRCARSD